jgi:carbon monoxide dehydrogenase subunit G
VTALDDLAAMACTRCELYECTSQRSSPTSRSARACSRSLVGVRSIEVRRRLRADVETVWDALADIAAHVEWMADARSIRFTSATTEGVGTTFECVTKVGPIRLVDRMEVTEWVPEQALAVRHTGIVTGEGRFTVMPVGAGSELAWRESLRLPWWLPSWPASIVLRQIWRWNLRAFERTLGPAATAGRGVRRRAPRLRRAR